MNHHIIPPQAAGSRHIRTIRVRRIAVMKALDGEGTINERAVVATRSTHTEKVVVHTRPANDDIDGCVLRQVQRSPGEEKRVLGVKHENCLYGTIRIPEFGCLPLCHVEEGVNGSDATVQRRQYTQMHWRDSASQFMRLRNGVAPCLRIQEI